MLAPILVSVYTRLDLLQQCITSVKANAISADSDLYIVSDAAKSDADDEKVAAVRAYIASLSDFKSVTVINRETNLGSFLSVKLAIDWVLERHGRVIFLEDDNWVAPNFLQFINDGLDFYQDDGRIFSVSGYNFPIRIPPSYPYDVYVWQGFTAWGVGLWDDRWRTINWDVDALGSVLLNKERVQRINRVAEHVVPIARACIQKNKLAIDAVVSVDLVETGRYSIFPIVSKVRNIGHDGRGEHSGTSSRYMKQLIDPGLPYQLVSNLQPDDEISQILRRHFKTPLKAKVISVFTRVIPKRQKVWLKRYLYPQRKSR